MRNEKTVSHPPTGFNTFLQGILDANIPLGSFGNKYVKLTETCPKNAQVGKMCENSQMKRVHQNKKNSACKLDDVERLKKLYCDPKESCSFGGVKRLIEANGLKKSRVKTFLHKRIVIYIFTSFS
ncbi:hypothetical protein TNIN_308701 [Trichonephila inaurata madagascariensis]|uniref:Uncharacterized protein n=1 Tax=Trichonephila inaurata madagascariensis TaxID=2747483 RepID=A0A8X6XGY0_9ARAC|nr:hypothetical protein TNIN_308701 [Trichonephila inaurata madagascariensis]